MAFSDISSKKAAGDNNLFTLFPASTLMRQGKRPHLAVCKKRLKDRGGRLKPLLLELHTAQEKKWRGVCVKKKKKGKEASKRKE